MGIITNEDIFDFCRTYDWQKKLNNLEKIILSERWSFINDKEDAKNKQNPILENYIKHIFVRLYHLCEKEENEKKYLYCDNSLLCFNTGLYTVHYEKIFVLLKQDIKIEDSKQYSLVDFVKESDFRICDFEYLPDRPQFIEKIEDLIYDTSLELRINSAHILSDENNIQRIPAEIRDAKNLQMLFDGAITQVKRKVESNYKVAVPQYYDGKVQLLLPLCLLEPEKVDLVLVVTRKNNSYAGRTCLTLDMAYNNARLIAKPESPWLAR
jgi:hypothetical protein